MASWKRGDSRDEIELAAGTPDAPAVLDAEGNLIGWDESAVHLYEAASGMTTRCDAACVADGHIDYLSKRWSDMRKG